MLRAFIKTDFNENPEVITDLTQRLTSQGITPFLTELDWKEILCSEPFLWYRTPYLRFSRERDILDFHYQNLDMCYLTTNDGETISVSPIFKETFSFVLDAESSYFQPSIEPLPILMGTNCRPLYFQLTLNSLLYSLKDPQQKLYIVVSQPDPETLKIISNLLETKSQVEAVLVENNLKYAFANFGTKFFDLPKFIHHEDDAILPENTHHLIPFWTRQLNYRSTTADLTTFIVAENATSDLLKSPIIRGNDGILKLPAKSRWFYTRKNPNVLFPIGGMGMVIDSAKLYRDFLPPAYHQTDMRAYNQSEIICLVNAPIYHLGANEKMDYPEYSAKKKNIVDLAVDRIQKGTNMRTKETKIIDLGVDWKDHGRAS